MIRALAVLGLLSFGLTACGSQAPREGGARGYVPNTNAALAGETLQCSAKGPVAPLTFGKDGRIAGRFLDTDASGNWFALADGSVEVHVDAGAVSVRDVLRRSGGAWSGRNISCS